MKRLRRAALSIALGGAVMCLTLLLNFTASNPTGRRYSSQVADTTSSAQLKGQSGEAILAADLRLAKNDACICGAPGNCPVCFVEMPVSSKGGVFRKPDFLSDRFVADAKNSARLPNTADELAELRDYSAAALATGRQFWIFARVNTEIVDPELYDLTRRTGGDIVFYLAVDGWQDPVDALARRVLLIAAVVFFLLFVWELLVWRSRRPTEPEPEQPHTVRIPVRRAPKDPLGKALDSVERAERHAKDQQERARARIDVPYRANGGHHTNGANHAHDQSND